MFRGAKRDSIARSAARLAAGAAAWLAIACAAPKTPPPALPKLAGGEQAAALSNVLANAPREAPQDALVVTLAFGAGADLDLYVTDPLTETVYFANTPVRSGGALRDDLACDAPAPRVETVVFETPIAGRYRVGVDHMRSCGRGEAADFAVRATRGNASWSAEGALPLGRFDPIVLELDLE